MHCPPPSPVRERGGAMEKEKGARERERERDKNKTTDHMYVNTKTDKTNRQDPKKQTKSVV